MVVMEASACSAWLCVVSGKPEPFSFIYANESGSARV